MDARAVRPYHVRPYRVRPYCVRPYRVRPYRVRPYRVRPYRARRHPFLGGSRKGVWVADAEGLDGVEDKGEAFLQVGDVTIFVVFVGIVVAAGDVGTTDPDAAQCQGQDVGCFSLSDYISEFFSLEGFLKFR
ncbi:MAG: hypothetical protein J1E63_06075 [Muribaculaceae bacterium]|nr:hypothetical protein [Muribaculaceae bacterium]